MFCSAGNPKTRSRARHAKSSGAVVTLGWETYREGSRHGRPQGEPGGEVEAMATMECHDKGRAVGVAVATQHTAAANAQLAVPSHPPLSSLCL